jgi:pimeloyl-ACP methyl ester carboxylesterase
MVAIVLHVLDGGFVHTAPGTSASDHLATSGLTVALAMLTMVAWPILGPIGRAAMALSVGFLAVSAGVITAIAEAVSEGIATDDVSGFVMVAGGALLLVLGAVLAWRNLRRPPHGDLRRTARWALITLAGITLLYYVLAPLLIAVYATHPRQAGVTRIDLGVPYEQVAFTTEDGLRLAGWFIPSRNGATIVAVPGANSDRTDVAEHAAMLARHGYGVLLFDPRGNGESEGDPNHFGWHATKDVRAALEFLRGRPDVDPTRIGALGLSMGGEAVLQTTSQDTSIRAIVAEGAGARSLDEVLLQPGVAKWIALPQTWLAYTTAGFLSRAAPPPSLKELVPLIAPRPLLLIYAAGSEQAGEARLNPIYYEAAREPKEICAIPDTGHTEGIIAHPTDYEVRVIAFLDRALLLRAV